MYPKKFSKKEETKEKKGRGKKNGGILQKAARLHVGVSRSGMGGQVKDKAFTCHTGMGAGLSVTI